MTLPPPPTPHPRSKAAEDAANVKAVRALDLRAAGYTFAQIADALGYTDPAGAHKAYTRALEREVSASAEDRERLRGEQHLRIERMLRALWPQVIKGDTQSIGSATRLLERQARLHGLDAPTRLTISDEMDAEIEGLMEDLRRLSPPVPNPVDTGA